MKTVILTEKPDQARKYAKALGTVTKGKGYLEVKTNILQGEIVITWGIGHLVSLAPMASYGKQYEKWDLNNLPFHPEKMIYEVSNNTKAHFNIVKKQLESADQIIIATDPDREGENIAYSIFMKCSSKVRNAPKKRLWCNSYSANEVQRAFKNLKDSKETYNYFREAQTRQISDYLVGMNFTQYFTLLTQSKGLKGVYSIGRVQTPTNSIVCENDLAIKYFKEETFYKIYGQVNKENRTIKFTNEEKYESKEKLLENLEKYSLNKEIETTINSVKKEIKTKQAPKLFNLGGIQSYANKKWRYSLDKTLKVVQSLYQSGYLSYPRTDCELITTGEFEYLKENLEVYKQLLDLSFSNGHLEPRKRFVDNEKVLEHYAIIPTDEIPNLSSLTKDQKNIYEAVVRHTVLMFAEDYKYESTTVTINANGMPFKASGNVPKQLGWTAVEKTTEEDDDKGNETTLPEFTEGEMVLFVPKTEEGKTKPPARLTEASLGGKGGVMEKLNIGTPATRSSIVKTLIDREYIEVEKTKLYPTEKGKLLYDMTKNILIGKPEMTATWEEYLAKIGKGEGTQQVFLKNINNFINKTLTSLKSKGINSEKIERVKKANEIEIGDYIVIEKSKVFECTNKSDKDDKFIIFKNMSGKKIGKTIVKPLLEKGKSRLIKGFISKKGNKFDAYLVLEKGKVSMEFPKKRSNK